MQLRKTLFVYALTLTPLLAGCATHPPTPKREITLSITSNIDGAQILAKLKGNTSSVGTTPFNGIASLPAQTFTLLIDADPRAFSPKTTNKILVPAGTETIEFHAEFTDLAEAARERKRQEVATLTAEFNSLSVPIRMKVIEIIDAYAITASTPNYLVKSKANEAKMLLNQVAVEFPELRTTSFFAHLKRLQTNVNLSLFLKSDEITPVVDFLKKITGQL